MTEESLFDNYKYCEYCHRPMAISYEDSVCPTCREQLLFHQVKDFIRSHDVNEYAVAEHFGISPKQVKKWIREGRIEYKDEHLNPRLTMHCEKCGAPITFGTLCTKCLRQSNTKGAGAAVFSAPTKMRYLDHSDSQQHFK